MTTRPTIIFDLGGVLIDWNPRYLYRKLIGDERQMEHFLSEICSPSWNAELDRGRSFAEAVASLSQEYPEHAALIAAYQARWPEMLGGPIEGTVALLEALRARGFALHALTNWSAETFPIAQARYPFLHHFGEIVVSGEERLVKPDEAIFQRLLIRVQRPAASCLFIDDNRPNVEMAARLGFDAILFDSPAQLQRELKDRHLLS